MYRINFLLLIFSLLTLFSCDENPSPDQENFLSETSVEDLYGNENYQIFLFALKKSEDFAMDSDEPSTVEILKKTNPIIGDVFNVFIPTDSSLKKLHPDAFDNYTNEDWYKFVRSHIYAGTLSLSSIDNIDMLEGSVNFLGEGYEIAISNDSVKFSAEGIGFDKDVLGRPNAILTSKGTNLITHEDSRAHSIEGDFVNFRPITPEEYKLSELKGTWDIVGANVLDTSIGGVEITFNAENTTYSITGLSTFSDANLNHSEVLAASGGFSLNENLDVLSLTPGGDLSIVSLNKEWGNLSLSYAAPYPKASDDPTTIILSLKLQ